MSGDPRSASESNAPEAASAEYAVDRVVSDDDRQRWTALLRSSFNANPFSELAFLNAISEVSGAKYDIWVAKKGESWQAGAAVFYLPGMEGSRAVHPPLIPYEPVVYYAQLLAKSYPSKITSEFAALTRPLALKIATTYRNTSQILLPETYDIRPWLWEGWSATPHYTYVMDLTKAPPFSPAVKKHVKKCESAGFRVSEEWNLEHFWKMFSLTSQRKSISIDIDKSRFFLLANKLHAEGMCVMMTALSSSGQPAASRIVLGRPGASRAFDWVAGNDPAFFTSGVSSWMMTRLAESLRAKGFTHWDLCGADNESVARFKSELGGTLSVYFHVKAPVTLKSKLLDTLRDTGARAKRIIRNRGSEHDQG